jgi:hypothetical protein
MNDLTERLQRARESAPDVSADLDRLYGKRDAHAKRARFSAIALAGVIGLVTVGLVLGSMTSGRGVVPGPASGGRVGPPHVNLALGDGDYYYQRLAVAGTVYETWWATDDSGKIAKVSGGEGFSLYEGVYGPGEFRSDTGPTDFLSTDPTELEARLRGEVVASTAPAGSGPSSIPQGVEPGLIAWISVLLEAPDVTPLQKAALFQVAAGLHGVAVDLTATDRWGRPAILLMSETDGQLREWYFDPESEQLLVEVNDGTVYWALQASGVTHATDTTQLDRSFFADMLTSGSRPSST